MERVLPEQTAVETGAPMDYWLERAETIHWIVMWMAVAITAIIFAIGNILFGHFEEKTPKWRRVTKVVLVLGMVAALAARFGPAWGLFPIGLMLVAFVVFHLWWLPHRYGINGLTAEPKEKYYEFRGWNRRT